MSNWYYNYKKNDVCEEDLKIEVMRFCIQQNILPSSPFSTSLEVFLKLEEAFIAMRTEYNKLITHFDDELTLLAEDYAKQLQDVEKELSSTIQLKNKANIQLKLEMDDIKNENNRLQEQLDFFQNMYIPDMKHDFQVVSERLLELAPQSPLKASLHRDIQKMTGLEAVQEE